MSLESRIPPEHPLREIKRICDEALKRMCPLFDGIYSETGRPSIPPERLLKAQLLIALYSLRSARMLCERLDYDLLFRWFLDMTLDESTFVPSVFSKNRERLVAHEVGKEFLDEIVQLARSKYALSQKKRKLVEQPFGWAKAFGGLRKTRFIGIARSELLAQCTLAAFNLARIAHLTGTACSP